VPENVAIVSLGQECQRDNPRLASKVGSKMISLPLSTTFLHISPLLGQKPEKTQITSHDFFLFFF